jgi:hypothetical protein
MNQELRSDRIAVANERGGARQQEVLRLLRGAQRPEDALARSRRAGIRRQLRRTLSDLESLTRRSAAEAPDLQDRLRRALEALQLLGCRLSLDSGQEPPRDEALGLPQGASREIF